MALSDGVGLRGSRDAAGARRAVVAALADSAPLWLVIDLEDAEAVERDLTALAGVLDHVRLAVTAHCDLLGGPSTAGRLVEIDETLLSFRPDEAINLLPAIAVEQVESLLEITEGWAAAMLAAAAADAGGHHDVVGWLRTRGVDRLFAAWFADLPTAPRDFLLATAVLDILTGGACDAAPRDADDSASLLSSLTRSHGHVQELTQSHHGERAWRRHPLLTVFLRRLTQDDASKPAAPLPRGRLVSRPRGRAGGDAAPARGGPCRRCPVATCASTSRLLLPRPDMARRPSIGTRHCPERSTAPCRCGCCACAGATH